MYANENCLNSTVQNKMLKYVQRQRISLTKYQDVNKLSLSCKTDMLIKIERNLLTRENLTVKKVRIPKLQLPAMVPIYQLYRLPRLGNTMLVKLELWEKLQYLKYNLVCHLSYAYATLQQSGAGNSTFRSKLTGNELENIGYTRLIAVTNVKIKRVDYDYKVSDKILIHQDGILRKQSPSGEIHGP